MIEKSGQPRITSASHNCKNLSARPLSHCPNFISHNCSCDRSRQSLMDTDCILIVDEC